VYPGSFLIVVESVPVQGDPLPMSLFNTIR